jgi:histidinol-phosphate aminotransferase
MTDVRIRADLAQIPGYRPGKPALVNSDRPSFKLSSNENPFTPLASVRERIASALQEVNLYPNMGAPELVLRIAEGVGVSADEVVVGAGSVEVVSQLIRAVASVGDNVIFPWRSFEAYPLLVVGAGATPVRVPLLGGFRHDLEAMLARIDSRTRLVIVCSPNNPTGTTVQHEEIDAFLARVPRDVVVLIDEAYLHYNKDAGSAVGIDLYRRYPNVVLAHTFSKAYGLAGLRVGYAVAPKPLATAMRKVALPFGVTGLAQAAALASLDAEAELRERIEATVAERERMYSILGSYDLGIPRSEANFFWIPTEEVETVDEVFARHGVVARLFDGQGVRVSVGSRPANDATLGALAELNQAKGQRYAPSDEKKEK